MAIAILAVGGGTGAFLATHPRAARGIAKVEPGPLSIGHIAAATSTRSAGCSGDRAERPEGREFALGTRHFYVWGPSQRDAAAPIVLAFHGWGSNGRQFEKWFELERYVEDGAFVVYPDADGPNWDYSGERDITFAREIVDKVAATYCVDTARVLALGFSYGGRFVNHLACKSPDLVRAIVVAGSRWDEGETACVKPMPVLVVHRTHDGTMSISGGRDAASRWAKVDGCAASTPVSNGCLAWTGCQAGAVTFCEDTHFDPEWPPAWNHTMRESYELLAWRWFTQI